MKTLQISNLSKTYSNGVKALNNVNLTINSGMFGLLGPNGAGKSTLMRTISTLQEADSGTITLDGINVLKEKDEVRKILGFLPQEFDFYPRISAIDMLSHFAVLKGISNSKEKKMIVNALLNKVNLWDKRHKKVGGFSGGMKQRLGIAQALLGDPELVIVDEPTAGLDPKERHHFHNLLSEIGENKIVILSTHIVDDVADLCSDMALINAGEVILTANPIEILKTFEGKIWKKIIEKNELEKYSKDNEIVMHRLYAGKYQIHIFSETDPQNSFSIVEPNLEDVYFRFIPNQSQLLEG